MSRFLIFLYKMNLDSNDTLIMEKVRLIFETLGGVTFASSGSMVQEAL